MNLHIFRMILATATLVVPAAALAQFSTNIGFTAPIPKNSPAPALAPAGLTAPKQSPNAVNQIYGPIPTQLWAAPGRKEAISSGGILDGGGGDFFFNDREQVIKTISETWKLVTISREDNPILVAYNLLQSNRVTSLDRYVFEMLTRILSIDESHPLPDQHLAFADFRDLELIKYLEGKDVKKLDKSLCDGPDDQQFMASVTQLDRAGEICVSVYGLKKLPTASLQGDLLALFIHEIAHLNGFEEVDARLIQRYFLNHLSQILRLDGKETKNSFSRSLGIKIDQWNDLITYDPIDRHYLELLTTLGTDFSEISLRLPVAYDGDNFPIANPQLYDRTNSYLATTSEHLENLRDELKAQMKGRKSLPVNAHWLSRFRDCGMEMLNLMGEVNIYLYGDGPLSQDAQYFAGKINREKLLLRKATQPVTLTDPKARPNLDHLNDYFKPN